MTEPTTQPEPKPAGGQNFAVSHAVVPAPDGKLLVHLQLELNGLAISAWRFPPELVPQVLQLITQNLSEALMEVQRQAGIVSAPASVLTQLPSLPPNGRLLPPRR